MNYTPKALLVEAFLLDFRGLLKLPVLLACPLLCLLAALFVANVILWAWDALAGAGATLLPAWKFSFGTTELEGIFPEVGRTTFVGWYEAYGTFLKGWFCKTLFPIGIFFFLVETPPFVDDVPKPIGKVFLLPPMCAWLPEPWLLGFASEASLVRATFPEKAPPLPDFDVGELIWWDEELYWGGWWWNGKGPPDWSSLPINCLLLAEAGYGG